MRRAQAECRERIATCRKLLDELNGILATSRSHASYRTGCAARDAMSRTLARLEELDADYTSWLGSLVRATCPTFSNPATPRPQEQIE